MKKTIHITHGAMTLALTALILFADRITMGFFMPFLALPLIIYGAHYSMQESLIVALSTVFLAMMLSGMLPTVISSIGYSLVGLMYIYCYHEDKSRGQYYFWMSLVMAGFYYIMIRFFGEYFGVDILETIRFAQEYMPKGAPVSLIKGIAYFSVLITMLMEVFIVKVSADIVIMALKRSGYGRLK